MMMMMMMMIIIIIIIMPYEDMLMPLSDSAYLSKGLVDLCDPL